MRIISKDGRFDSPYETSTVEKIDGLLGIKVNGKVFVTYNSEEERTVGMEMLWASYLDDKKIFRFS